MLQKITLILGTADCNQGNLPNLSGRPLHMLMLWQGVQAAKKKDASGAGQAGMGLPTVEVLLERFEMMQNEKGSPSDSDSDSNSTSSNESEPDGTQASQAHSRTSTDTSSSTLDSDIDVSNKQLSSGSYRSMYIDPVT
jgi:hypothetical protein